MRGVVYLVGAGPGDPGLITVRGLELLRSADVVLRDELVHPALLAETRAGAEVVYVGKRGTDPASKQTAQWSIEEALVREARAGRSVVRLKGGDPFLFGRGSEEAETLTRAGIPFEVVPGIPSPLGASAYAGISLTHRDLASSVTFVSGTTRYGAPFDWSELASVSGTICVFMGMRRIEEVTRAMIETARRGPDTPCAAVQWGTRAEQRVVEAPLSELAEAARRAGLGSPAMILIGRVTTLRKTLRWFDAQPLFGKRVLVLRTPGQADHTAELLQRRGASPVLCPLLTLAPPPDPDRAREAIGALGSYDYTLFTSENAVDRVVRALEGAGRDARAFGGSRVAAVGPGTAAALARFGVRADLTPDRYDGDALADAVLADEGVRARLARGLTPRIFLPRALVAREALPQALRSAGCEVDVVPVYQTAPASPEQIAAVRSLLDEGAVDVVLLTSSSTADRLAEVVEGRPDRLANVLVASIGPITTRAAEGHGMKVGVTATESTIAGLLDVIAAIA